MSVQEIKEAIDSYKLRRGVDTFEPKAALIDMDGVLYDSMPLHTAAWYRMMTELGVECSQDEFYLYEGMTGRATIRLLMKRHFNREVSDEECDRMYAVKSEYFNAYGERKPMPFADIMLNVLKEAGLQRVLVTGSGQKSLLNTLDRDYPEVFGPDKRVTAADVRHGKPDPEPYIRGLEKAGVASNGAIVIENAPLGVEAGHAAGCFVVAVTTGPISKDKMTAAGADIVFKSMEECARQLPVLLQLCNQKK